MLAREEKGATKKVIRLELRIGNYQQKLQRLRAQI